MVRGLPGPWGQVVSDEGVCYDSQDPPCPGPQVLQATSLIQHCVHLALRLLFDTDFLLEVYERTRKLLLGFKPFNSVYWRKILSSDPVTVPVCLYF